MAKSKRKKSEPELVKCKPPKGVKLPKGVVLMRREGISGRPKQFLTEQMRKRVAARKRKGQTINATVEELNLPLSLVRRTFKELNEENS